MASRRLLSAAFLLLASAVLHAEDAPADMSRGDHLRDAYFRSQVKQIAGASLADVHSLADWEKRRPEMRRRFLDMLGLWPLPPRTDLHAIVTGKLETDNYIIEKLHFQSMPGLYVTANLYVPKELKAPAPAVLYLCGHGKVVVDGVSCGNKCYYQRHPAWFASHGYVCLIVDTLELGEIQGMHHGTAESGRWWWQTIGYTPAGVECWSAMRALDYLETRKEVDPKRIGVTGRSGGGATSWWVAAADDRPQSIIPVAGIDDLQCHICEGDDPRYKDGVISGHCDCMYMNNTYRWDFTEVMALCAPRPLMLENGDQDYIFPKEGYRRMAEKVRRLYQLYGAGERFVLFETHDPHKDTPPLRMAAYCWMNHWLMGEDGEVTEPEPNKFEPKQLKVFDRSPDDAVNASLDELFRKPADLELPRSPEVARAWWAGKAPELRDALGDKVFRGWPNAPPPLGVTPAEDVTADGLRLRAYDFVSEEEVPVRLWLVTAEKVDKSSLVILNALDEPGWKEWAEELGPPFTKALQLSADPKRNEAKFAQNRKALEYNRWAFAAVAPRGVGPTRWSEGSPFDGKPAGQHILRRFALLGQTLDGQRVWDVRRAVAALRTLDAVRGAPVWLQGDSDMAGVALYAALFEPDVARLDLYHPPASHRQGPIFLNVRLVLDMPQAVALAFPRQVRIYVKDDEEAKAWEWPVQLQKALGKEYLQVRTVGE
jgi:cephalosporin-C deacetylase-like acetyl esterase